MSADSGQRIERIVGLLAAAPKYRNLSPETLTRVASWALVRYRSDKEILKAAKRKLHQVYAAYLTPKAAIRLSQLAASPHERRDACREALSLHASTAERLPILEELYGRIFAVTGVPNRVLDLACGLHPFGLPWMGLAQGASYLAMDIDCELMALLGSFFPQELAAECRDILVRPPEEPADVAFLLKAVPVLEQQERGASLKLLRALRAGYAVVSFPAHSLGGRAKGMEGHYAALAGELIETLGTDAEVLRYPSETFYVVRLASSPR
ncbi:MAG TPA: 16S rRNA methyltransferase [Thermoanaerobaculia bacterium]|nr:16S rRNA methyltransferase [Thermoanaerobaculia bacterium]